MYERNCMQQLIVKFQTAPQDQIAFIMYDGADLSHISYSALAQDVLQSAGFFMDSGISGKHVALIGPNSYQWLIAFLAITATGNVAVPMNCGLSSSILIHQCNTSDVSHICGDPDYFSDMTSLFPCFSFSEIKGRRIPTLAELPPCPDERTAVLVSTSGTTGKSKLAMLSYSNMESSIRSPDGFFTTSRAERYMTVLPLYHVSGLRSVLAMLYRLKTLCIGRGLSHLFQDMAVLSPSDVLMVPMMVDSLVKFLKHLPMEVVRAKFVGQNLTRICVGGASVDPDACHFLMERGFTIDSGYAMTETTGVGTWGEWNLSNSGTIGKLSSELQCRIEAGELLFKGPSIMQGYYKDPAATAAAITDGWLHSGDLGYCDAQGYYYITGRKKDLIVLSNGEKLNPIELERYLRQCEAILDCRIYCSQDTICLDVYTKNIGEVQAFLNHYRQSMPTAFHIHKVNYLEKPLTRTSTGKILRRETTP